MAITYDIENDYLFKKGKKEGVEGEKIETILTLFEDGFSLTQIAKYARASIDFVKEVLQSTPSFIETEFTSMHA